MESDAQKSEPGLAVPPHVPWLEPYPDRLLEHAAPDDPHARVIAKETIELAFLVAMPFLPPKQRAVLILRDVLDWSAKETALLLDDSVPAVNGALQRARVTLRGRRPSRTSQRPQMEPDVQERALLEQYVAATERCDADAIARLLRDDVAFSMPPDPFAAAGRERVVQSWIEGGFGARRTTTFGAASPARTECRQWPTTFAARATSCIAHSAWTYSGSRTV